jgi:predicted nuclease of predicted toxin-antitoxin system
LKLLFDQNLSSRLPAQLADLFPESAHVRLLAMDRASDTEIWVYARRYGFVIVTQDSDFAERSKLLGAPPNVVWLRCGNSTPQEIEAALRSHSTAIVELSKENAPSFIEIF